MQLNIKKVSKAIKKKNGWEIQIDISPKKTYRWLKSTQTSLITKENANQNYNEVV